jgi:hypothetical protein
MVITSDAERHATRPALPPGGGADDGADDGADEGSVAGDDGAADAVLPGVVALGTVAVGAVAVGAVAVGAVAAGADVGLAGAPVAVVGCPASAGWRAPGEPQATSTDDVAIAAPASSAALGNVNDVLKNDADMGGPSVLSLRVSTVSLIPGMAASNLSYP